VKILVAGAGAVGCFLGARLALAGHALTLVGRESVVRAVNAGGLTLEEPDGVRQATGVIAATSIGAALADGAPYDLALITVKAYDTDAVATEVAQHPGMPPLLTLQNGVGNEEALAERVGEVRVLSGAIDTPVSVPAPGRVRVHRARYKIGLAPVGKQAPALALTRLQALFSEAGFAVDLFPDHRGLKWTKLLMNMLANASCAILDWTPAQVMANPVTAHLEALAWQEAMDVIAALGVRPVRLAGYPFPLLLPIARRAPAAWLAYALRGFVSGGRGSKMPSLQIALSAGKPSEVGWLNGAVARQAGLLHLSAPVNCALTDLLTALARGDASRADFRGQPAAVAALVRQP
jgi:2-dehydropantoate 2-reductase